MHRFICLILGVCLPMVALASPAKLADLPPELEAWVPWVLQDHPNLACPLSGSDRVCVWPGVLSLQASHAGARFEMDVTVDAPADVALPGTKGAWPRDVRVDGRQTPVMEVGGVPTVALEPGKHRVTGAWVWASRPPQLPLPRFVGRVDFVLDGEPVPAPRIDGGALVLGQVQTDVRTGERMDIRVSRKVRDGVPASVVTELVIQVSGRAREIDLGDVVVPGSRPVDLTATVPARFTPEGTLLVQVRPGTFALTFEAIFDGAPAQMSKPVVGEPWPAVEYWAVALAPELRAVDVGGPPAIDPARTTLPQAWRTLPVYAMDGSVPMSFTELRRGDPEPPPNRISLHRSFWLDLDGGGLTVRDALTTNMAQGWRLNLAPGVSVGRITVDDVGQVVTSDDEGRVGVEVRGAQAAVVADYRLEGAPTSLLAAGWDHDIQELHAQLMLPPGWTLLAGTGIDTLDGSVLARWTLFDLFFVLVMAMATSRLAGWKWGLIMGLTLVLTRHTGGAPQWLWAGLLVGVALMRVVPASGWGHTLVKSYHVVVLAVFAVVALSFAQTHVRNGLFPHLEDRSEFGFLDVLNQEVSMGSRASMSSMEDDAAYLGGDAGEGWKAKKQGVKDLRLQVDPSAAVQTGPGLPDWSWNVRPLAWAGPVRADHEMRLYLLSPAKNLVLAFLRVLLILGLGMRLARETVTALRPPSAHAAATGAVVALCLAIGASSTAHAAPSPEILKALEDRLIASPDCAPNCVVVPELALSVAGERLVIDAQVHAGTDGSWPVPGPASTWVPERVTVDGVTTTAMARLADGHLHVRLPQGVHRVVASGPLPASDAVGLAFGLLPQRVSWEAEGWTVDGLKADGQAQASVQIARMIGESTIAQSAENLVPWVVVSREVDLGVMWQVTTTVSRHAPTDRSLLIHVPLLDGEAVTSGDIEPVDGVAPITLGRGVSEVRWTSTLQPAASIELTVPDDATWTEAWALTCSPIFTCDASGPPPSRHVSGEVWSPRWSVWPGERVTVDVGRPEGVPGQTMTMHKARLEVRPGRRQLEGELTVVVRASQGGMRAIGLPDGAALQSVKVNGTARPLRLKDDGTLDLPIQPGETEATVVWQQDVGATLWDRVPAVDLGGPAVNVTVAVVPPRERWVAALFGPRWGPVPLLWSGILIMLLAAPLLARVPGSPLRTWQWLLLGLGMNQVPMVVPVIVAAWFFALVVRRDKPAQHAWVFNVVQLGLVMLTIAAAVALYASIHVGLLGEPDMQITGNGSSSWRYIWYVDRVAQLTPQPSILWFPVWIWRVVMLLWALWLASSLVRWVPWGWQAWTAGGWARSMRRSTPEA